MTKTSTDKKLLCSYFARRLDAKSHKEIMKIPARKSLVRIRPLLLLLAGLLVLNLPIFYYSISRIFLIQEELRDRQDAMTGLNYFLYLVSDLESKQRTFLLAPNTFHANDFNSSVLNARNHLRALFAKSRKDASSQNLIKAGSIFDHRVQTLGTINSLRMREGLPAAINQFFSVGMDEEMRILRQTVEQMVEDENWMILEGNSRLFEQLSQFRNIIFTSSALCIVLLGALFFIYVRDEKDHQKILHKLKDLEARYRALVDNAHVIFWAVNSKENFTVFEGRGLDLIGYHENEMIGKNYYDFFQDPRVRHPLVQAEKGECLKQDVQIRDRWFETIFIPMKIENEDAVAGISLDVTDRRKAEQVAKLGNEAKSRFLANMSHEIRTPIGIISGFADLALSPLVSEKERNSFLVKMKKNSEVLADLVNDILDLSKVEAGKLEVEKHEMDLPILLEELIETFSFKAREKGLSFLFQIYAPLPRKIISDLTRIRQVLANMLGNSLKFTQSGFIKLSVDVTNISHQMVELRFFVQDSGIGISEAEAPRIFKPFSQADSSTTRKFGGTGLGLALSKKLALSLNGDLRLISSEKGRGSIFAFNIFVSVIGTETFTQLDNAVRAVPAAEEEVSLKGLKILLVEDSLDNQYLVGKILRAVGAEVDMANDGEAGVEEASHRKYDVILMDIQMPRMDGFEATKRLRAQGYRQRIIALTANALKEEKEFALTQGFDDYLTKPIQKKYLIESLKRAQTHLAQTT